MKKLIVMTMMFISTATLMAVTGCFDSSEHSMLFDEVMQGRTPGTISNPGGSGSNPAPSGSSQNSGDESQDSGDDGGGDDGGGSTPSYDKPAVFGDGGSIELTPDVTTAWNEDGYITTSLGDLDFETGEEIVNTYRINDLGEPDGEWGDAEAGYNGLLTASGYDFHVQITDSGLVRLFNRENGSTLFSNGLGTANVWSEGERSVAEGWMTQEQLDAAKTIIENVSE